ncbi:hypothetical protein OUZ56_000443 [Daphnia magna]|uniref:Uncharacterized protein n=1 Tax=Daphnia magna TaxID=35525 RepID=A0ABQ9ZZP4_9CRUS|nr:hypothetical protein OUZ56_000443 [Daphnia magna]
MQCNSPSVRPGFLDVIGQRPLWWGCQQMDADAQILLNERDKNVPTFMFKFNFIFNLVCKVFMEGTTMITTQRKIYCKNLELYMHVGEGEKLNLHGELKYFSSLVRVDLIAFKLSFPLQKIT